MQFPWEQFIKLLEITLLPFGVYIVKTLSSIQKEVSDLKTVLIGIDGKNGIRSRVVRIERRLDGVKHQDGEDE